MHRHYSISDADVSRKEKAWFTGVTTAGAK